MDKSKTNSNYEKLASRMDRLPAWGLPYIIIPALGLSYFMVFYDADSIGFALPYISFITASEGALISSLGLVGYAIGAIFFSYLSDLYGRKSVLIVTALLTGIGSFGDAFAVNAIELIVFRMISGIAIGADIVLVMAYMIEMSPGKIRGKISNIIFIVGAAGIGIGNLMASILVTSIHTSLGWRLVFGIGGSLAILAIALRLYMPESVRYLCLAGKYDEAESIVSTMEQRSMKRANLTTLPPPQPLSYTIEKTNPFKSILNKKIGIRLSILYIFQFFFYFADYAYAIMIPTWVKTLGYGTAYLNHFILLFGYAMLATLAGAIILRYVIDVVDRRKLLILVVILYGLGSIITAYGAINRDLTLSFIGMIIALLGLGWIQVNYVVFADNFPSRGRATGMAITDGAGHFGGSVGLLLILPALAALGAIYGWAAFWLPALGMAFVVLAFTPFTNKSRLEEVNEMVLSEREKTVEIEESEVKASEK